MPLCYLDPEVRYQGVNETLIAPLGLFFSKLSLGGSRIPRGGG